MVAVSPLGVLVQKLRALPCTGVGAAVVEKVRADRLVAEDLEAGAVRKRPAERALALPSARSSARRLQPKLALERRAEDHEGAVNARADHPQRPLRDDLPARNKAKALLLVERLDTLQDVQGVHEGRILQVQVVDVVLQLSAVARRGGWLPREEKRQQPEPCEAKREQHLDCELRRVCRNRAEEIPSLYEEDPQSQREEEQPGADEQDTRAPAIAQRSERLGAEFLHGRLDERLPALWIHGLAAFAQSLGLRAGAPAGGVDGRGRQSGGRLERVPPEPDRREPDRQVGPGDEELGA